MNTKLNNRLTKTATKLFERLTQEGTYKTITSGGIDLNTGQATNTITEIAIYCRRSNPTKGDIESGLASKEESVILTAGSYFTDKPKQDDKITIQNDTYTIRQIISIDAVNDVAYYKFICGRG